MPDRLAPLIRENTVRSIFSKPISAMLPSELSWNSPPLSTKMVSGPRGRRPPLSWILVKLKTLCEPGTKVAAQIARFGRMNGLGRLIEP
jgi:hypothetical protein